MKTIWKFPLSMHDIAFVSMPKDAEVLCVNEQRGSLFVWAMVESANPLEVRRFRVAGTGHCLEGEATDNYVGTAMLAGGSLVFHVFDFGPETP